MYYLVKHTKKTYSIFLLCNQSNEYRQETLDCLLKKGKLPGVKQKMSLKLWKGYSFLDSVVTLFVNFSRRTCKHATIVLKAKFTLCKLNTCVPMRKIEIRPCVLVWIPWFMMMRRENVLWVLNKKMSLKE